MIDPDFYEVSDPVTVERIAAVLGAKLRGDAVAGTMVSTITEIGADNLDGALIYVEHTKYLSALAGKRCSALLTTPGIAEKLDKEVAHAVLLHKAPRAAFAKATALLVKSRMEHYGLNARDPRQHAPRIHSSALIDETAIIGQEVSIGPHTVIGPGVHIGDHSYIGSNVTISHAHIGADCFISAGAVIGEAGFGVAVDETGTVRVPQVGAVVIEDRVSIGSNTTIDRGGLNNTVIGQGTQIDNLVQIAHNVVIGRNCLIASHVGISGSCEIGSNVMMGGQVGIADHVKVGDNVVLTGRAGIMKDIPANEKWGGYPARPASVWMREMATLSRLTKQKRSRT